MAVAEELDVKAAIERFLADEARASLELPPMSAAQRKQVKAIADAFPSLVSESFGMGADRCIHLFKREASKEGTAAVAGGFWTLKNGFIDDWVAPAAGEDAVEPVVFRSMPTQLSEASRLPLLAGRLPTSKLDLSPITEGSPKLQRDAFRLGSGGKAAAADGSPPSLGQSAALPTLLGSFQAPQVRNTFVHFDTAAPSDDRSVQSMPHDMFRQCLEEEAAARLAALEGGEDDEQGDPMTAARSCPAPAEPAAVVQAVEAIAPCDALPAGAEVTIQGLTKIPAFNGQRGVVERLDAATGRYSIRLTTGGPGIPKFAKVKAANLRVAATLMTTPPPAWPAAQKESQAFFGQYSNMGAPLQLTALV